MNTVELRSTSILIPALLFAFAACAGDPVASSPDQSQLVVAFASLAAAPHAGMGTGSHVVECPAGGSINIDGEQAYTSNDTGSILMWNRSMTYDDCALDRSGGTAIADGHMQSVGEVHFGKPVDQVAPLTYHLATQTGSLTTTFNGVSETCAYDLAHAFEVDSNRYRITGTVCGRTVNMTVPAHQP